MRLDLWEGGLGGVHGGGEVGGVREDQGAIRGDASIGHDQGSELGVGLPGAVWGGGGREGV